MTINRFEQVDHPPDDAMTLTLARDGAASSGFVTCPASATGGRLPKDFSSGALPPKDAFRAAIRFANEVKVPLVVLDHDGLWQPEWGDLYRDGGQEPDAG
ncbi:hypothetical protein [Methylobacterium sp. J-090]|uniref:hypothetical protein n=1 Tax=Methylobacterium sp. J-090 TaxID=2836666 RepID=UPI001FB91D8C|nr:hypothetical protein [Methylobacterium sp. J-090]MCJ2081722.1 hypothetical protein [Methylobacterium sp. J-090]